MSEEAYAIVYRNKPRFKGCDEYLADRHNTSTSADINKAVLFRTPEDAMAPFRKLILDDAHEKAEIVVIKLTLKEV